MATTITKPKKRYGVTEKKKAELDQLTLEVIDAQQQVDQFQSIVTALTQKQNNFQALLAAADTNRTNALNNKNLVDSVVQNFKDLQNNSGIAFFALSEADMLTKKLAHRIKVVLDKLIYAAEVINKLAAYVIQKKALNPLVSDDLISILNTAGTDANNAVALTLVALQTTYTAQASNTEAEAASSLEYIQAMAVYQYLTGTNDEDEVVQKGSLQRHLHNAYTSSRTYYQKILDALQITTKQLNDAQISLNEAQLVLAALQAGLAAGNAAALA